MLASGLPDRVRDDEDLARFVRFSNQIGAGMAKPAAFLPSPKDNETSVFRHGSEPKDALWALGSNHLTGHTIYGAGIVKAADVRAATLEVIAEEPPLRHAAIRGWPSLDDPDEQKAKRKQLALLVASRSVLVTP